MGREEGPGWGTHVYLWQIHFNIWQNQCNIVKFKNKIKLKKKKAGQVLWYSHLLKNFPQFIVIHAVKGFGIVNRAEIDVFLELSCFSHDPADVGNLISGSSAFSFKKKIILFLYFTILY